MGEFTLTQEVNQGLYDLINHVSENVTQFGETYATIIRQQEIADELGKSVRTIYRQINTLKEKKIIDVETRRGRNGGSVLVFNPEHIKFKSHKDNPFTGKTRNAKELRDKYYPNKGTYKPDNRTPEQIARDKVESKRRRTLESRMNADLTYKAFPDKEFFNMAENPKETFKTYMLSRAYNSVLITRLEVWKNEAERAGDEKSFEMALREYRRYRNYDVLPHEFMGTQTFNNFDTLRKLIDAKKYDVIDYLNNAFDTFIYLLKQGRRARPPFVNTLYSDKTVESYAKQVKWKKDFEREHPYYAKPGEVNTKGYYYPINQIINRAYNNPMDESLDMQEIITAHLNNLDFVASDIAKKNYYRMIINKIKTGDYTDEQKHQMINFFNEKISVQLISNMPEVDYIIANLRKIKNNDDVPEGIEMNTREWYYNRGDIGVNSGSKRLINKRNIKRGYLIDFSVSGGTSFEGVWRVVEHSSTYAWDYRVILPVIKDLEEFIPFTELGDVDLEQVLKETLREEAVSAQNEIDKLHDKMKEEDDERYLEETLDNEPEMWYDILEDVVGSSLRDGRNIVN